MTAPASQHSNPEFRIQIWFNPVAGSDQDLDPVFLKNWICIRNRIFYLDGVVRIRVFWRLRSGSATLLTTIANVIYGLIASHPLQFGFALLVSHCEMNSYPCYWGNKFKFSSKKGNRSQFRPPPPLKKNSGSFPHNIPTWLLKKHLCTIRKDYRTIWSLD